MELRAFVQIFFLHKKLFWSIIALALIGGFVFYVTQPIRYSVSTTLNVARTGNIENQHREDYASFYRLQADERFADTVVRWLQSPRIVADILEASDIDVTAYDNRTLRNTITAKRLSSQVIDVQFIATDEEQGRKQVQAMITKLNKTTEDLNKDISSGSWFHIVAQEPVIHFYEKGFVTVMIVSFVAGFMLAFVIVVLRHYYTEDD